MPLLEKLVGAKISEILVNDDQSILAFKTDKGDFAFETEGDCCSETWFADITGVEALVGGTVSSVQDIDDVPEVEDGRSRQDSDQFYGAKIVTDKGVSDVIYRNSSNGYYGGHAEYKTTFPDTTDWESITADWQAGEPKGR